jgi:hypothetical protein
MVDPLLEKVCKEGGINSQTFQKNIAFIDGLGILTCPNCKQGNLHQERVESVFRIEDGDGQSVSSNLAMKGATTKDMNRKDIPGRRNVAYIDFTCEHCDHLMALRLVIQQHKGSTYMYWVY